MAEKLNESFHCMSFSSVTTTEASLSYQLAKILLNRLKCSSLSDRDLSQKVDSVKTEGQ